MPAASPLVFDSLPAARFVFDGPIGERVQVNLENWLLRAPQANPGMLEMFRLRDRQPTPQLVPWAGEFVGKYLISAVQAMKMSEDPRLQPQVAEVVAQLIASQADDGYLGPFPKPERLLKYWDLWGHYHVILALLLWHEHSGDTAALATARRAADLVCATYLDTGRRVFDAGDHEMNMAILTALAKLHRLTAEPRYLRMAHEVERDWERAGDYLRTGLAGREFFQSPRPRWESLHDLQGLVEMWRITHDAKYREAFEHHWRSLRRWDRRNTGGFSSGEQATGNPFAPTAIETCCTVAWMALTVDHLRLTGDPHAADELELSTLNGGLGAQHPSGRWWTYNTPMDGVREASAHSIVFQARAGTPELNCCSVNGPRVLGLLSEWALMMSTNGLVLNWLGSGRFTGTLPNGTPVTITSTGEVWRDGRTELSVATATPDSFSLLVRIPTWARKVNARLNGQLLTDVQPGNYLTLQRAWTANDRLELSCNLPLRFVVGANEAAGKVSVYRGPVLLAYDQAQNPFDEDAMPMMDLARLESATVTHPAKVPGPRGWRTPPWLLVRVPTVDEQLLSLVDFANAGSAGTRYRSWLTAKPLPPAPAFTQRPPDAARVPAGPVLFQWRGPRNRQISYRIELSSDPLFSTGIIWQTNTTNRQLVLDTSALWPDREPPQIPLWWRVISLDGTSETLADVPTASFRIDASMPPQSLPAPPPLGPGAELIAHSLRGDAAPAYGQLKSAQFVHRDATGTELNGRDQMLVYALSAWPEEDFTVSLRFCVRELPPNRLGQVFSAWTSALDDPLRLVIDHSKIVARLEAGSVYSTPGTAIEPGRWYAVAGVKQEGQLTLYLEGRPVGSCAVPLSINTQAQDCALGGNPHFSGNEFLAVRLADFVFYARALSPQEIKTLSTSK